MYNDGADRTEIQAEEEERDCPAREETLQSGGAGEARPRSVQVLYVVPVLPYLHIKFHHPFPTNVQSLSMLLHSLPNHCFLRSTAI